VIAGTVRRDRRSKRLAGRLRPGDIAVIDHLDLDRVAAESLVTAEVSAVLNARPSISGRYPNLGPEVLVRAGIPLLDDLGEGLFELLREGERVQLDVDTVLRDGEPVARGVRHDPETVAAAMNAAREGLSVQLESFVANTMEYLKQERDLLLDGVGVPDIETGIAGRHCLVVVRGYDYEADLDVLRPYIREFKPVLIGVDGGADALVEAGYTPDLIIGDMDSVTTEALLSGAELVVHAYTGGDAPGLERLEALGLPNVVFEAPGTSEDIAMLLAHERGAELIVAVGTHANLIEFLDKGRRGMASTFLTRLRVGPILVDAKGVSRLYRGRVRRKDLMMLLASALLTMVIVVSLSEPMRVYLETQWLRIVNVWFDIQQAVFG
jgi:uncharacterized membrane-anchored protein